MKFPNRDELGSTLEVYLSKEDEIHRDCLRLLMGQPVPTILESHPQIWFSQPNHLHFGLAYLGPVQVSLGQILTLWHREALQLPCSCGGQIYVEGMGGSPLSGSHSLFGFCPRCQQAQKTRLPQGKSLLQFARPLLEFYHRQTNPRSTPRWAWPFTVAFAAMEGKRPMACVRDKKHVTQMTYDYFSDQTLIRGEPIHRWRDDAGDFVVNRSPMCWSNDRWVDRISPTEPVMPLVSLAPIKRGEARRADPKIVKHERLLYQFGEYIGRSGLAPMFHCATPLPDHVLIQLSQWFIHRDGGQNGLIE